MILLGLISLNLPQPRPDLCNTVVCLYLILFLIGKYVTGNASRARAELGLVFKPCLDIKMFTFCSAKSKKKKANQRRRLWVSSFFKLTFIYEHWLVNTASWEDPEAIVFVSNTFMSSCAICLIIAREIGNWELHTGSSIKMAANRQETVSSLLNQAIRLWSNDTKQERFQAGKKCNRCQFCFGLVLIYQPGHA